MAQLGDVRVREDGNGDFHVEVYSPYLYTSGSDWLKESYLHVFKTEDEAITTARRLKAEQIRQDNIKITKRVFYI